MQNGFIDYFNSPIGLVEVTASEKGISGLYFREERKQKSKENEILVQCLEQLNEYFLGDREVFDLPLDLSGTEFQKDIWNLLLRIPFGKTTTYLNLAKEHGDANALRAVGSANGKNPVSIIVPCHRVIGSDGSLTGYAGGLWRKKWLLDHESKFTQLEMF